MRTLIDTLCPGCGDVHPDVWVELGEARALGPCRRCGHERERLLRHAKAPGVVPDSIPGGYWVEHGLCNSDGTPRRYDSRSEMAREAKRRGLRLSVEHKGSEGSDKSVHTTRWT